jgi:hypothetical protein
MVVIVRAHVISEPTGGGFGVAAFGEANFGE